MKLSTKSRYSARILIELARHKQNTPLQTGKISRRQDIPLKYLEQLITVLRKAGFIESFRGPKGGHKLAMASSQIMLGQIVRLFEGQTDLVQCISSPETCKMADECRLRLAWQQATESLYQKLDVISIESLLEKSVTTSPDAHCQLILAPDIRD
ncbi:MAG: Rrf2 family transcriptional regulator [Proteobacteria bacterium]|nr:Rrf2 family transcriptional regulator [Pseudomonadota bacterium]